MTIEHSASGYFGAKDGNGVFQRIIAEMPPHDTYIETHLGGGAILRRKPPAARTIALEVDPGAVAAFDFGGRHDIEIVEGRCEDFLTNFDFSTAGRVLIYADPPYVLATRSSSKRYRFDYDDDDHRRLLTILKALPAAIMISGYPSVLYDLHLSGWRNIEFQTMTRGGPRTEKLWMNFSSGPVAWATFAGENRTKRQHVKRMAERWAAKYAARPYIERLAIMAKLMEVDARSEAQPLPAIVAGGRSRVELQQLEQPDFLQLLVREASS